jgi:hypothetical protein
VTVVIAGIFFIILGTSYRVIASQQQSIIRYTTANSIAKANLNKYRTGSNVTCDTANPSADIVLLTDTAGTPASSSPEPKPTGNYPNFTQKVVANYFHGCAALATLTSTVSYGPSNSTEVVTQVDYAK